MSTLDAPVKDYGSLVRLAVELGGRVVE